MKLQRLEHPPRWGARAAARTGRGTTATGHGAALILSVYYTYRAKLGQVPISSNLFQNLQARSACENFEEICGRA